MELHVIDTGFFKLDGGAMFGVVPKVLWSRLEEPDNQNLCTWAMRCLLIDTGDKKILIDTGIGDKQSEKFFSHFHPHGDDSLVQSIHQKGYQLSDITDVILTHLHFDHVGGAVIRDENNVHKPLFTNATYWTNRAHYEWALNPNDREKASFLKENFVPLKEAGVLKFLEEGAFDQVISFSDDIDMGYAYGHTEAMMIPHIRYEDKTIVYCADLLPSPSHLSMPYVMGYDIRPLQTLKEKAFFLNKAVEENYILFFEHAKVVEACTIGKNEKGRFTVTQSGKLSDFL